MNEMIHGLVSGLIWTVILGSCLIAIAAIIVATAPADERVRDTAAGTGRTLDVSPISEAASPGRIASLDPIRPGPRRGLGVAIPPCKRD